MIAAKHHAIGRSPCIPRAATGVRQISRPHAAVTPNSHSLNSDGAVGNHQPNLPQRGHGWVIHPQKAGGRLIKDVQCEGAAQRKPCNAKTRC
jgi:hypothetical protein